MINRPLVSIIVVSYNHRKFIRENLDSIKNQTYKNIELIVADDASGDASTEIFDQWLNENNFTAKKNYHKTNTGFATMCNECIDLAEGQYVKLIAADDYLDPNYIDECVNFLKSTKLLAVYTQAFLVDSRSLIINDKCFPNVDYTNVSQMFANLMENNFVPGSTLFVNRDVYEKIGRYDNNTLLEDYNLALRMSSANLLIGKISKSLVYYRSHRDNISKKKWNLLQLTTIKEKVAFDYEGHFSEIIEKDIRHEIATGNTLTDELKMLHLQLKKRTLLTKWAVIKPRTYKFLVILKEYCLRKLRIN